MAKFEDWDAMKEEIVESIDIYGNIVMHYEDERRRTKMTAELNVLAQMYGGPEILFDHFHNCIHFTDRVVISKRKAEER
jgi:hypothetical protein